MATMERPEKTKKTKKQPNISCKYETITPQLDSDVDSGDCDHMGAHKSSDTSALLLPSSAADIDQLLNENETPALPGATDPSLLSPEELQERAPANRRSAFTAAVKRSFSGFAKNGVDTGTVMIENKDGQQTVHAEVAENEKPRDIFAMFSTNVPLTIDKQTQCDEHKRVRARQQMLESLESLRDVCLHTLDRLLSVLLSNTTMNPYGAKRLEDDVEGSTQSSATGINENSSNEDLLKSIYFKSNQLALERLSSGSSGSQQNPVPDVPLSPLTSANNEKYLLAILERLNACSPPVPNDDFTLTSGLASLLNGVYHIMQDCDFPKGTSSANELSLTDDSEKTSTSPVTNGAGTTSDLANSNPKVLYSTLRQHMAKFQDHRAASEGNLTIGTDAPSALWRETDRLMELVATLLRDRPESPQKRNSHSRTDIASLPSYGDIHSSGQHLSGDKKADGDEKKLVSRMSLKSVDIANVLGALDRVMEVVPRMNDQRVDLSDKQERAIAAASLSKAIVRLSKGRLEGQRADTSGRQQRMDALDLMIDRIAKSSKSQLNDQRVSLTDNQTRNLELAKITGVLDKASKSRMDKQEWQSPVQMKDQDMRKLSRQLEETMLPKLESHQRYKLSAHKEKEMFMANIMGKMNRLSDRRMDGQDATSPLDRKHERFQEIDTVMDRMTRGLDEQKFCKPDNTPTSAVSLPARPQGPRTCEPQSNDPPARASPRTRKSH